MAIAHGMIFLNSFSYSGSYFKYMDDDSQISLVTFEGGLLSRVSSEVSSEVSSDVYG